MYHTSDLRRSLYNLETDFECGQSQEETNRALVNLLRNVIFDLEDLEQKVKRIEYDE